MNIYEEEIQKGISFMTSQNLQSATLTNPIFKSPNRSKNGLKSAKKG